MGASAILLAMGLLYASHSSLFRVRDLEVAGTSHLTRGEVVRLSGITGRTNVVWLDASTVERRLESNPWVAGATVSRSLPATVRVAIVERTPVAARAEGDGFRLIAGDGTSLGIARRDGGLPVIVTPPSAKVPVPNLAETARAIALLRSDAGAHLRRVVMGFDGALELRVADGPRIRYGPPVDLAAKAEALRAVLRWASRDGVRLRVVDLTAPATPAVVVEA
jgi:cell division protein FtsQ